MKNLIRKYPQLGSSQNPDKLSLTIGSMLLALVPLFIAIARMFEIELAEADLVQVINAITGIISMVGVIVGVTRKYIK